MEKVAVSNIVPGAIIAKSIYTEDGLLLAPHGMVLFEKGIKKLLELGIQEAYVVYPETNTSRILQMYDESPHIDDIICEKTAQNAKKLIKHVMTKVLPEENINIEKINDMIDEIIEQLFSVKDIVLTLSRLRTIDDYTYEHSVSVCVVSLIIGMNLELKVPELKTLGTGALLHDVGKVCISEEVLKKPASLTFDEYCEVKSHTEIGYKLLIKSGVSEEAAQIALFHHEKYDGTGYNRKLSGEQIPYLSRIVTLADSYDAMSSDRYYRKRLAPDRVYKEIASLSGQQFDSNIADRFLRIIDLYPIGTGVVLNTRHKGVVVKQNKFLPQSPVIRVFKDHSDPRNANCSTNYVDIDLTKTKYLFIVDTF